MFLIAVFLLSLIIFSCSAAKSISKFISFLSTELTLQAKQKKMMITRLSRLFCKMNSKLLQLKARPLRTTSPITREMPQAMKMLLPMMMKTFKAYQIVVFTSSVTKVVADYIKFSSMRDQMIKRSNYARIRSKFSTQGNMIVYLINRQIVRQMHNESTQTLFLVRIRQLQRLLIFLQSKQCKASKNDNTPVRTIQPTQRNVMLKQKTGSQFAIPADQFYQQFAMSKDCEASDDCGYSYDDIEPVVSSYILIIYIYRNL